MTNKSGIMMTKKNRKINKKKNSFSPKKSSWDTPRQYTEECHLHLYTYTNPPK